MCIYHFVEMFMVKKSNYYIYIMYIYDIWKEKYGIYMIQLRRYTATSPSMWWPRPGFSCKFTWERIFTKPSLIKVTLLIVLLPVKMIFITIYYPVYLTQGLLNSWSYHLKNTLLLISMHFNVSKTVKDYSLIICYTKFILFLV